MICLNFPNSKSIRMSRKLQLVALRQQQEEEPERLAAARVALTHACPHIQYVFFPEAVEISFLYIWYRQDFFQQQQQQPHTHTHKLTSTKKHEKQPKKKKILSKPVRLCIENDFLVGGNC